MYGCESWTIKNTECQRTDAFELFCWGRLLRVPWTARRSNQSILEEISPGCSLEGLMLKLKLQYFGRLMQRVDSLEKILMLGGIGSRRRRGRQRMTQWTWVWVDSGSWWWTGRPSWGQKESDMTEWLNWTELNWTQVTCKYCILLHREFTIWGLWYGRECPGTNRPWILRTDWTCTCA